MKEITEPTAVTRRGMLVSATASLGLLTVGCVPRARNSAPSSQLSQEHYADVYGPLPDERFPVPAVKLSRVKPQYYRRRVSYETSRSAGTVIVDTKSFYLYLVEANGKAMQYGVGLGRAGFEWSGAGDIAWKRKWPTWTPPAEMIERDPRLARFSAANGGMKPGLRNPLGARALYIYQNGKDTLYRLHGTPDARSIGKAMSSGCVRLLNHDVIDLYTRVKPGAKIVVV